MMRKTLLLILAVGLMQVMAPQPVTAAYPTSADYACVPPFISSGAPPLVMLVMGRDHKLYYEAYNDASDLDGDGDLDVGFNPSIIYYGYFDSEKCYTYNSGSERYDPVRNPADGKCNQSGEWHGNWLNYATMTRMDTLRKVLYGGKRLIDTDTLTVLDRAYIPRDAHTFGKEYESEAADGYHISDYTPLALPPAGTRHLFATTSLYDPSDSNYRPLLRVLPNNTHRIWEWVAKERPVADSSLVSSGTTDTTHPTDHSTYDDLVSRFVNAAHLQGSGPATQINGSGNPYGSDDHYITIFSGFLVINAGQEGDYDFAVDGDDAVEFILDGNVVAGWYGGHGRCSCQSYNGTVTGLTAGNHVLEFRHEEVTGGDNYYLYWRGPATGGAWQLVPAANFSNLTQSTYNKTTASSTITDYVVRVKVADTAMPESNCRLYPNGGYKPIGILQRYGEPETMFYGLITGSYAKNTQGGVLRKNIGSINDEINSNSGRFIYMYDTSVNGIIKTLDKLRVYGFDYGGYSHNNNCGWIATRPINAGECRMWANPVGEMMYEALRYYSGAGSPTSTFTYTSGDDVNLGLPLATWDDPFSAASGYASCARPFMMVISDIYPSFDSDSLPGVYSQFGTFGGSLGTMNVQSLTDTIGTEEGLTGTFYVGQVGTTFDTSCSPKTITNLGQVRGLCEEEPTKQGSYYSAAVAYYGRNNDLHSTANGDQKVTTYAVGLSSPLPRIEIPIQGSVITLVPFAKSVGGYSISAAQGSFQPTNTIVDFFVSEIDAANGRGQFRINYEDVEQGADHDMDAIVVYDYQILDSAGVPVTSANLSSGTQVRINLNSEYAAGSIIQHMGYIISGTTADGTYLEVRDADTGASSDPDYFLDTPPGQIPGGTWNDGTALPLTASRTFQPGTSSGAKLMTNPLYYAAKWGGFEDSDGNGLPNLNSEWDKDGDNTPDTYFYVVNPLKLEEQLNKSFSSILERASSGTAASVISGSRTGEGALFQALFYPTLSDTSNNTLAWSGQLHALFVDHWGNFREDSNQNAALDPSVDRIVQLYFDTGQNKTMVRFYNDSNGDGLADGAGVTGEIGDIKTLWDGSKWVSAATATATRAYGGTSSARRIWTFIDRDGDGFVDDDGTALGNESAAVAETMLFNNTDINYRTTLAPYLMARAIMSTNLTGSDNDIEFTAVDPGPLGDGITIEYVNPGPNNAATSVNVVGNVITVNLATNSSSTIIASAAQVVNAVNNDAASSTMVKANLPEGSVGGGIVTTMTATALDLDDGTEKLMSWVIGNDQEYYRKRQINKSGSTLTWKLGDIIYSTPTSVAQPQEDYDLIFDDNSYFNFRRAFANRRQVVYVGTNDGYLRAINAGFWDRINRVFNKTMNVYPYTWNSATKRYDINYASTYAPVSYDLGAEMWAFIPQAILPHLQWLKERDYPHVYMVDMKPKITDIRLANGQWRTVLICGMRLGGQDIEVLGDFDYNGSVPSTEKRLFHAEVFCLDITDPESQPKLMWSFSHPELGATTSYPTVVRSGESWFVVVGSGPHGTGVKEGRSDQNGRIFVINAETGMQARTSGPFIVSENTSFLSDPVAIKKNISDTTIINSERAWFNDYVYIGSTSGSPGNWDGTMHRIVLRDDDPLTDDENPDNWDLTTFMAVNGPISSAPNVSRDSAGNLWVYFGTGRFWSVDDKAECLSVCNPTPSDPACIACKADSHRWMFGAVEPRDATTGDYTHAEVQMSALYDVTDVEIYEGGDADTDGTPGTDTTFIELINDIRAAGGWKLNFSEEGERSLYQPVVLGGIVSFTTYQPSDDICDYEGNSYLYAVYYLTGTAYTKSVIGLGGKTIGSGPTLRHDVLRKVDLGTGVGAAPTIHIGEESKVMIQSSTGAIISIVQETAHEVKSGLRAWLEDL